MGISFAQNTTRLTRSIQDENTRIDLSIKPAILAYMDGYEFERELVATLVYLIEREGMKHEPTVEMAWKGRKDAGPAWQKIRNKVPPQKLTVRDAYDLTRTMGWSFAEICGIVQGRMLDRKPLPQGEKQLPQGENQLLLEGERGRPSKAREK